MIIEYQADGLYRENPILVPNANVFERLWVESTDDALKSGADCNSDGQFHWEKGESPCRWRDPDSMQKWASRIKLKIINTRKEHLQNMSEEGAKSVSDFQQQVWQKIYPSGEKSWETNPEVLVIDFARTEALVKSEMLYGRLMADL